LLRHEALPADRIMRGVETGGFARTPAIREDASMKTWRRIAELQERFLRSN